MLNADRHVEPHEVVGGVQIIVARLVDNANESVLFRESIAKRRVQLAQLERCCVAIVANANGEGHRSTHATTYAFSYRNSGAKSAPLGQTIVSYSRLNSRKYDGSFSGSNTGPQSS